MALSIINHLFWGSSPAFQRSGGRSAGVGVWGQHRTGREKHRRLVRKGREVGELNRAEMRRPLMVKISIKSELSQKFVSFPDFQWFSDGGHYVFYSFDITRNHTDPCHFLDHGRILRRGLGSMLNMWWSISLRRLRTRRRKHGGRACYIGQIWAEIYLQCQSARFSARLSHWHVYVMLFPTFRRFQLVSRIDMNKFVDDNSTGLKYRVILLHFARSSYNDHNFACFDSYL